MRLNKTSITRQRPHRLAALTLTASLAFCSLPAVAGELHHTLRFAPGSVVSDTVASPDGTPYLRFYAEDCSCIAEPGAPALPYRTVNFHVPLYSKDFTVEVEASTVAETRTMTIPIWPVQNPVSANDWIPGLFTAPSAEAYAVSPPQAMVTGDFLVNGDQRVISVSVAVALPEPDTSELSLLSSVSVCLKFAQGTPDEMDFVPVSGPASANDIDLAELVVNPPAKPMNAEVESSSMTLVALPSWYYILVPEYLKEHVHDLAMWKRQKGHNVRVVTYEEIMADSSCNVVDSVASFDPESHMRNWLINEKAKVGIFQLLIVGDEKAGSPIRKFYRNDISSLNPESEDYHGENFVPTDLYFSDITSKFVIDKQANGYYSGKEDSQPINPCLPVGRLLVNKPDDIKNFIRKLLIYETDPGLGDPTYLNRGMAFLQASMILWEDETLLPYLSHLTERIFLYDQMMPDTYEQNRPTGKEVIDAMRGCGVISMHGHGSPFTIRCSGAHNGDYNDHRYIVSQSSYGTNVTGHEHCENGNGFDNLENASAPAIALAASCDVSPFDIITSKSDTAYNLGAAFTVAGNYGGPAFIGNTRLDWIVECDDLEVEFGKSVDAGLKIGQALVNTCFPVLKSKHSYLTRCLIGDPDLKIWLGAPDMMDVSATVSGGNLSITGSDLEGAKIVVYDGKDNISNYYSSSQPLVSPFENSMSTYGRDFAVSVFKDDRMPYTFLFADRSLIYNDRKTYFLTQGYVKNYVDSGKPCFYVTNGGRLDLMCTRGLTSDGAFCLNSFGELNINSLSGVVRLSGDTFTQESKVSVTAPEVLLDKGFSIDGNATIEINPCK